MGVDNAVNDEDATPGDYPTHAADATAAAIANANLLYKQKSEKFYTQLGTKDGVRDLIVDTNDPALLIELKHTIWDFSRQTPLELIDHVRAQVKDQDAVKFTELVARRNTPPDLGGNKRLSTYYRELNELIAVLKNDFNSTTETKEIIAAHCLIYSQDKDHAFCEACVT